MLGNHEKMALISSTTNEWPQIDDQQRHQKRNNFNHNTTPMMASSSSSPAAASKPPAGQDQLQLNHQQQQQQQQLIHQQQALKCPRCDSSNTKFCYYNNYSLSQPRHFCKACKRYWTRGGTLRNVPVGGGCRKNKRIKRPGITCSSSSPADGGPSSSSTSSLPTNSNNIVSSSPNIPSSQQSHLDQMNPIFYGLPSNPFMDSSNTSSTPASGFDFHQLAGLGFDNYRNRFSNSSNYPIFSTSQSAPTMASVLASKFINVGGFSTKDVQARGSGGGGQAHQNNNQYFQTLLPFEDLQIAAGNHGDGGGNGGTGAKDVKVEDHNHHQNRLEWSTNNNISNSSINANEQMGMGMSDPTLYWSAANLGSNWHDPANLGSSVSSLI